MPNLYLSDGRMIDLAKPDSLRIRDDIARPLSRIPRYCGHTPKFYSVAEHCVIIANELIQDSNDKNLAKQALFHEVGEAMGVSDICGQVKRGLGKVARQRLKAHDGVFYDYLGLPKVLDPYIDIYDSMLLIDEISQFFNSDKVDFKSKEMAQTRGLGVTIQCWDSERAEEEFMKIYYEIQDMN